MDATYNSRRIFRSSLTSQSVIRELLQMIFTSELMNPGREVWLVSPWISEIPIIDNQSGAFDVINPSWRGQSVKLSEIMTHMMSFGTSVIVVTRNDEHNSYFLDRMTENATELGVEDNLSVYKSDTLHTKGILTQNGVLLGSMNITFNGMEINEEYIEYQNSREEIATAGLAFETYREELS